MKTLTLEIDMVNPDKSFIISDIGVVYPIRDLSELEEDNYQIIVRK